MPRCKNCNGFVTENYVQVFAPEGTDQVRTCPNCENEPREGAGVSDTHPID